jgi:L-malate glycosyltransferase
VSALKRAIRDFQPDVLHAHYATSYGMVGALAGFHPFIISSWGTDVMKFPQKNFLNKKILQYNFKKADVLCATSNTIKEFINQVTDKPVEVIPFGVDVNVFKPKPVDSLFSGTDFVIGSIKPMERLYNIDILVRAFAKLSEKYHNMKLILIGNGREEENLKDMCSANKIRDKVIFTGRINFSEISNYFNMLDVLVNISYYESFGVSVVEGMACEKPVVVTNVGGLKEIVENDTFGSLVEPGDVDGTAAAIERYYLDKELCSRVGKAARAKVIEKYNWENNLDQMVEVYQKIVRR